MGDGSKSLPFEMLSTSGQRVFRFRDYEIGMRSGWPCGIICLHGAGKHLSFNNSPLPLADWEFLTFRRGPENREIRTKLLNDYWDGPEDSYAEKTVRVKLARKNVGCPGVNVGILYEVCVDEPFDAACPEQRRRAQGRCRFDVTYSITNHSGSVMKDASVFIGLPGFPNHRRILSVRNAVTKRVPRKPYKSFREEGAAAGRIYEVLRQTTEDDPVLQCTVTMAEPEGIYVLKSSYRPDDQVKSAYAVVVNKPKYMTCHFDARVGDISDGETRRLTVHYVLSLAPRREK